MAVAPRWDYLPGHDDAAAALVAALGIEPTVARLLCQRGLVAPDDASRFLNPSIDHLHDPMAMADMRVAVDRLLGAIARRERIAIHGDYDVDGITSTVILRRALELLGADVVHFIPERLRDGYGLQPAAIERLHADGVALVVSVDCGIRGRGRGAPRARAGRRPHHHRSPRAGHANCRRRSPSSTRSDPTATIPTSTSPASASR